MHVVSTGKDSEYVIDLQLSFIMWRMCSLKMSVRAVLDTYMQIGTRLTTKVVILATVRAYNQVTTKML